jgi:hypothetical protein
VFPDDVTQYGKRVGPLEAEQVVVLLWRNNFVPEWIDASIKRTDGKHSYIELLCCGRFTDQAKHLYYSKTDVCPFGVKSPALPPHWDSSGKKFDLHWQQYAT